MNKKKKIFPVFTRMKFVDVAKYVEPTFKHNKMTNGYAVGIGERNGQQFTFLIPFEEFPKEIETSNSKIIIHGKNGSNKEPSKRNGWNRNWRNRVYEPNWRNRNQRKVYTLRE